MLINKPHVTNEDWVNWSIRRWKGTQCKKDWLQNFLEKLVPCFCEPPLTPVWYHWVCRVDYCNVVFVGAPKSVTNKLQRVLNAGARVVSGTRKFDRGLTQLLHADLHWLDVPSASGTNSVWWCVDARTALLHSIWRYTRHQSLRLNHGGIFGRLPAINWQCRRIGGSHTAVGRLLSPARRRGTHCQNVYVTPPIVLLCLAVFSKHSFSLSTSVSSALEALATMCYINLRFTLHYITLPQTWEWLTSHCARESLKNLSKLALSLSRNARNTQNSVAGCKRNQHLKVVCLTVQTVHTDIDCVRNSDRLGDKCKIWYLSNFEVDLYEAVQYCLK